MPDLTSLAGALHPALLIPLFLVADRAFGMERDGKKTQGAKLAVALGVIVGGLLVGGVAGAMFGAAWFVVRTISWPDGSQTPRRPEEFALCVVRLGAIIPPAVLIAHWRGLDLSVTAFLFLAYTMAATVLHGRYGAAVTEAEANPDPIAAQAKLMATYGKIEAARGAAFGLALCAVLQWA